MNGWRRRQARLTAAIATSTNTIQFALGITTWPPDVTVCPDAFRRALASPMEPTRVTASITSARIQSRTPTRPTGWGRSANAAITHGGYGAAAACASLHERRSTTPQGVLDTGNQQQGVGKLPPLG